MPAADVPSATPAPGADGITPGTAPSRPILDAFIRFAESQSVPGPHGSAGHEVSPTYCYVVVSSPAAARAVVSPDDEVSSPVRHGGPAVVLEARGQFRGYAAKVPAGQPEPTGAVLLEVVPLSDGLVSDWALTAAAPDLGRLGPVVPFE